MITISVRSKSYGNNKQYIAHITGRAPKVNFAREFVGRKNGRGDVTEYCTDEIGLYEDCDIDRKGNKEVGYLLVAETPAGDLVEIRSCFEDALKIAKRFDDGDKLADVIEVRRNDSDTGWLYAPRTKAEAKAAVAAATVESAIEACWQAMQALPEREAKKVLAQLKLRVSPPKPAQAITEASAAE